MTHTHYHFDHVGSFLRPQALKEARAAYLDNKISEAELKKVQHEEIKKLVDHEAKVGLSAVTDGEFNRSWWHLDFLWGLNGVASYNQEDSYKFHGAKTRTTNIQLVDKIAFNPEHPFFSDFEYLKSVLPEGVEPKVTIPSPSLIPNRDHRSDRWPEFYENWTDFLDDLAKAYHETILHFYALGARYVQLDDTTWAYLIARLIDEPENHEKYEQMCEDIVYVINRILDGLPDDLRVTTHICRGNFKSTYLFEGSYEPVAKYLGQLNYDSFFLEYDDARSGSFAPLPEIWNHRANVLLVLGIFTSKKAELEDKSEILARLNEAQKYVPLKNLALSTQCGFASTEEGNQLTQEEQWAKLAYIKQVSDEVFKGI